MFLVVRVWDAFADLAAGRLVDLTRTRWGKFRPYLLFASLPLLLSSVALFSVPNFDSTTAKYIYAYITYALLGFLYSTPAYWPSLELLGWGERGPRLRQLTREGKWGEMPGVISDEMLDELLPTAPFAEIADVLRERYADLATTITFPLPEDPALDPQVARVIERLHA